MATLAEQTREMGSFLEGKSRMEVRSMCIEALRRWRSRDPGATVAAMHGALGLQLARDLVQATQSAIPPNELKEPFLYAQDAPELASVMDFAWWMIRVGFAVPQFAVRGGGSVVGGGVGQPPARIEVGGTADLLGLQLTVGGRRLLDGGDEHPLAPGYLVRLLERCPNLAEDVITPIEDAILCMGYRLLRPAVVLLGLAFETAVDDVLEHLAQRAIVELERVGRTAALRIETLRRTLPRLQFQRDELATATAAVDFADHLRDRRNDAAHPIESWPFDDKDEVEELTTSALRHLPHLWGIAAHEVRT
jgi:hypothetical protein